MKPKLLSFFLCLLLATHLSPSLSYGQDHQPPSAPTPKELTLTHAAMCEGIEGGPQNEAVVFSAARGKVFCFTDFDPVPTKAFVYHTWFQRDRLVAKVRLSVQPPRWSTYSRIILQEDRKGPWRVEITDQEGRVLHTLRLSVTD